MASTASPLGDRGADGVTREGQRGCCRSNGRVRGRGGRRRYLELNAPTETTPSLRRGDYYRGVDLKSTTCQYLKILVVPVVQSLNSSDGGTTDGPRFSLLVSGASRLLHKTPSPLRPVGLLRFRSHSPGSSARSRCHSDTCPVPSRRPAALGSGPCTHPSPCTRTSGTGSPRGLPTETRF